MTIPQIRYDQVNMEPVITGVERIVPTPKIHGDKNEKGLKVLATEAKEKTYKTMPHSVVVGSDGRVSIIILAWNQLSYTKICIESIKKQTDRRKYDLIVIDQGSTDGTLDYLVKELDGPGDTIIINTVNKGFSGGNNQGLQIAKTEFVLMLNNDCKIERAGWLDLLTDASCKCKDVGLFGAICMKGAPDNIKKMFDHVGPGKETDRWGYIEGWCLFGKRDLFLKLGGFDMRFNPAYGEDSDMCFRVKEMGLKIKAVKLPIRHYGSKSKGQLDKVISNQGDISRRRMFDKWISRTETGDFEEMEEIKKEESVKQERGPKKILIRRKGARGDVLLTTPIIRELKKMFPDSILVYETDCPDVLKNNPYVDRTEKHASRPDDYDMVLTPRYEKEMEKNAIDTMARQCGIVLSSKKLEVYLTDGLTAWAQNKIDPRKRYIAFHTGRAWLSKEWQIDKFKKVMGHYLSKGYGIVETGNAQTLYTGLGLNYRNCSILQTAALIKECCVFVGIDSGCAHLAKAVGTPACVIYGSVDPLSPKSDAVEYPIRIEDLDCKGCRGRTSAEWVECDKPEVYCLTRITPEMVITTIDRCISEEIDND
jgi:ADP-heptose:LPS heptosyltransferase